MGIIAITSTKSSYAYILAHNIDFVKGFVKSMAKIA